MPSIYYQLVVDADAVACGLACVVVLTYYYLHSHPSALAPVIPSVPLDRLRVVYFYFAMNSVYVVILQLSVLQVALGA
ncbi:uncharacterized protein B0H18DRAFT_1030135 [Fomitopsis serialis]|uniref:uncharacterized protein n=1 Tax=Fomitopsis serialis TaxID=139415 RepID=UPI0020071EF2|nr:uncharacterized protein B0H18DRAFT_1030135 [Neoantrodia serialis]KAH9918640.1 hypothetical protein B0H18DRAFT_1030135 [Neoantrodia serialis]